MRNLLLGWWLGLLVVPAAWAQDTAVTLDNGVSKTSFSVESLGEMEQVEVHTKTEWTGDTAVTFSGPLLRDVLSAAGFALSADDASEKTPYVPTIEVIAIDGYAVDIEFEKIIIEKNPIFATHMNGELLPKSNAPGWITYKLLENGEFDYELTPYWVWAIVSMGVPG